jgi:hypothetical protein
MRFLRFFILAFLILVLLGMVLVQWLAQKPIPETITYGMSFNTGYARELGLDWQETYDAILYDLGVRHIRLAAHWPMVEPENNQWNFEELDYQIRRAEEVGAEVVLAVGRRLPRWPECHIPTWVRSYPREAKNAEVLSYVETVVERYKDSPAVKIWQVENEPFLEVFAFEHCGKLDDQLLDAELALVRKLDPTRPVLVTDSGNLGTWYGAYSRGDMFGTSVYVYFWNPELGQFRTVLPPWAYRVKERLLRLWYGERDTVLIELSIEPWLIAPITETSLDIQFSRMNVEKFEDIVDYARDTRYDRQYLWGAEWWYWLKVRHNHPDMWERGRLLFERPEDDGTY